MNNLVYPYELGEEIKNGGYVKSTPRKWTEEEEKWLLQKKEEGFSYREIAQALGRTEVSVSIKAKRLKKRTENNTYNEPHLEKKYESNRAFYEKIQPKTALDAYCGVNNYWKNTTDMKVTTNDTDSEIEADYNEDAFKLLCKLYYHDKKYELIDLDPFGSAYECFDLATRMATKGLIITFGEQGHKRWKRLDFVSKRYDISTLNEFTTEKLIEKVVTIGRRHKKELTPVIIDEFRNITRVYFEITDYKETEQWKKKEETIEHVPQIK